MSPRAKARGGRGERRHPTEQYAEEADDGETYYDAPDEDGDPDDLDDEFDDEEAVYEEGEEQREETEHRGGGAGQRRAEVLTAPLAARAGMRHVADLTGKEPSGIASLEPADDGWLVGVEVIESHRIPSSIDVLGLYLAHVAADGSLLTYRRTRRYLRGRGDGGEGELR